MELIGEIIDIIYKNELNSYTIAEIETEKETTTIVGYLPFINVGETLKIIGEPVNHKEYGMQFKVKTFEKIMPQNLNSLERYLINGNIRGIGKAIAKRIIKEFGEETIHILKYESEKLSRIRGISEEKAKQISEDFIENGEVWQIVGFLEKFGIGAEYAQKVFDLFGVKAIGKIEENPYTLIDITRGVDFKQIDKMAINLGIDYNNEKRIKSGIKYSLILSTYNGHSCVIKENLIQFVLSLLDVSIENIEDNLIDLKVKNEIILEKREEQEYIYLDVYSKVEENIANKIKQLQKVKNTKNKNNIEKALNKVEKESEIKLSEKQKQAIKLINDNNVTIITGGPGTGKTTIIKTIIEIYEEEGYKTILCAPTGRAAKRMTEATGVEASTLHRLLEIGKIDEDKLNESINNYEGAPIDADIIIVDEVSMVDMFLMNYLLKCIYQGTKLILVGDEDQLASVGPGSVLKDLIHSEEIKTIHLDKIFRQAAKSKIILNAHKVNNGEKFLKKEDEELEENIKEDFFFVKENSQEKILKELISLCTGRLKKYGNYDFSKNIQVLSPTKKGSLGIKELNKVLQEKLNPKTYNVQEKSTMGVVYRVGDRIMQIKNNYDIFWEKETLGKKEIKSGVFNGEMGTILKIDENKKQVEIKFDDEKLVTYQYSELDQIEHSYAITIHKAQGSEFDVVIMIIPPAAPMLLTRNLLYTGITRAKEMLIIISNEKIIEFMINNIDSKKRNTGLEYKLKIIQ